MSDRPTRPARPRRNPFQLVTGSAPSGSEEPEDAPSAADGSSDAGTVPDRGRSPEPGDFPADPALHGTPSPASHPPRNAMDSRFYLRVAGLTRDAARVQESLPGVMEALLARGAFAAAHAWMPPSGDAEGKDSSADRPKTGHLWVAEDAERFAEIRQATEEHPGLPPGSTLEETARASEPQDLVHRAARAAGSVFGAVGPADLGERRARAAADSGLRGVVAFPVRAENRLAAVVELFSERDEEPDPVTWEAVEYVRAQLDGLAARERARAAVHRAARYCRRLGAQLEPTVARLREMEERYALLCRAAGEGLWDWDLRADRVFYSSRWKALLGHGPDEVGEAPSEWLDRIHPEDRDAVDLEIAEHLEWQAPRLESEHRLRHEDGSWRWVRVRAIALRDERGEAFRLAGSMADITDQRTRQERTFQDLLYHPGTGLPHRPLFMDRMELALRRRTRRPDRSFAVLDVWLDGVREVVGREGPRAADPLNEAIARRLSAILRPGDTAAHVGEDELGVLLEEVEGLEDAVRIGRRIQGSLARPIATDHGEVTLDAHVGVALVRSAHESGEAILREAALAMRRGRRREAELQVYDGSSAPRGTDDEAMAGELRQALREEGLHLEYQPIVALDDGRITGVEGLLRWEHPTRGRIPPDEFLPLAEEEGLLEEIGFWVLERACRQMVTWDERLALAFPPTIAVNLSERQLHDPGFVERATAVVEATGLAAERVRFDVPEGALTRDVRTATRVLEALRERGIRAAIDDFGTGHASLGYLHHFPVSTVKIDRSLVSGGAATSREWYLARTLVELARALELDVIAEGIETRDQFLRLRKIGCQQAQGYFFSGPVPPEAAELLLRDGYPLDLTAPQS